MTAVLAGLALVRRARWAVLVGAVLVWWLVWPPETLAALVSGLAVIVMVHRRLGHRGAGVGGLLRRRRPLTARVAVTVVAGLLFLVAAPPASAAAAEGDPAGSGLPTSTDYCRLAPPAETPGTGVAGFLDPQQHLPFDGTAYGDHGYAGFFWWSYDPGCVNSSTQLVGIQSPWDASGASQTTQAGNWLLGGAVLLDAWATGMRARALDPTTFSSLDKFIATVAGAGYSVLIQPWVWLPLVMLGLAVLTLAITGNMPEVLRRVAAAALGLTILTIAAAAPLDLIHTADQALVAAQQRIDTGVLTRLPADVLPQIQHCQFEQTALYTPRFDANGYLMIAGTACTQPHTPSLTDPAYTEYVNRWLYPEILVRNTIQRYWQLGMIGTDHLTGPDAELGARFLNGQAVNLMAPDLSKIQANAPAGAVWCTYSNNQQVCGRSTKPGPPKNIATAAETEYRDAVQAAGDSIYPYIQGRAGNRLSAGISALAAAAAAAPFPAAAYTAVLTARLLLRLGLIAGLVVGIAMMIRPDLARRVLNILAGSLLVVLVFSAAGSLMTYLSMVMLSPTQVAGYQLDPTAGVIILALASILAWVITRPIKRITGMFSYATTGNPAQLSEQRRRVSAGLGRLNPLHRRRRGRSDRVSDPQDAPTASTAPADPPRHSRPEHPPATTRRRTGGRTTVPADASEQPPRQRIPATAPDGKPSTVILRPVAGQAANAAAKQVRPAPVTARHASAPTDRIRHVDDQSTSTVSGNHADSPESPIGAGSRSAAGSDGSRIQRQIWTGHSWILAHDDRIFRPEPGSTGEHTTTPPAIADTEVFRPLDAPSWTEHRRPELAQAVPELPRTRTHTTTDDPLGRI